VTRIPVKVRAKRGGAKVTKLRTTVPLGGGRGSALNPLVQGLLYSKKLKDSK